MPYERLVKWIESMHFKNYDDGYNFIYNQQNGKVYKAQYIALETFFAGKEQFTELPFIPLAPPQPENVIQAIRGEPISPPSPPPMTQEPEVENFVNRLFNRLRGLFR